MSEFDNSEKEWNMTKIQFDLWANEQAVFATAFCLLSSIIGAAGDYWQNKK